MDNFEGADPGQPEFRLFAKQHLRPYASEWDRRGSIESSIVKDLAAAGWLAGVVPAGFGGVELDELTYGILCEEIGKACSSTRSLLTVQNMVAHTLARWGTEEQKATWLPRFASGEMVAAFCLTEPEVGSDAASVTTEILITEDRCVVTGKKIWVTFGQLADVYLVIGRTTDGPAAVLVPRGERGVEVSPIAGQLGLRAAMLADVFFDGCSVPATNLVGRPGFGFSHIASTALDHGRYSVAWGCVGIGQDCLDASVRHARDRVQFGEFLADKQLVRRMIAEMYAGVRAARLICESAGRLRRSRDPAAISETILAKYSAAKMLANVTADAVQILGASGVAPGRDVERHFRDAKVMRIIEGTEEMLQLTIAGHALREFG